MIAKQVAPRWTMCASTSDNPERRISVNTLPDGPPPGGRSATCPVTYAARQPFHRRSSMHSGGERRLGGALALVDEPLPEHSEIDVALDGTVGARYAASVHPDGRLGDVVVANDEHIMDLLE